MIASLRAEKGSGGLSLRGVARNENNTLCYCRSFIVERSCESLSIQEKIPVKANGEYTKDMKLRHPNSCWRLAIRHFWIFNDLKPKIADHVVICVGCLASRGEIIPHEDRVRCIEC